MKRRAWLTVLATALLVMMGIGPPATNAVGVEVSPTLMIDEAAVVAESVVAATPTLAVVDDGVAMVAAINMELNSVIIVAVTMAAVLALAMYVMYKKSSISATIDVNGLFRIKAKALERRMAQMARRAKRRTEGWVTALSPAWSPRVIPG